MATNTYVALDKVTLSSTAATATFSAIPATYTDLVVVANFLCSTDSNISAYVNGVNTGTSYSNTHLTGSGSAAASSRGSNQTTWQLSPGPIASETTSPETMIINLQNYSNTTTYKTALFRYGVVAATYKGVAATVGLYRDTAAITSFTLKTDQLFSVGSTFSLYGIKAWSDESSPKATGGYVTSDATYWYHRFPFSGTFTPNQSLSCDYVVVAGGGAGGNSDLNNVAGGGGAGGFRTSIGGSALSVTAQAYTITVGAGGAVGSTGANGGSGTTSTFSTISSSGGGGGGGSPASSGTQPGSNGGSGGGGGDTLSGNQVGGSGNSGSYSPVEGYAGGNCAASSAGGGGGATAVGTAGTGASAYVGGTGGAGTFNVITNAVQVGQLSSGDYYVSGGGGGGAETTGGNGGLGGGGKGGQNAGGVGRLGVAGTVNTGGGGGGARSSGTGGPNNGGSGIVIVRYAK